MPPAFCTWPASARHEADWHDARHRYAMAVTDTIEVEVAYATPERQLILKVEVPQETTAVEAIRLSGIEEQFPEIDLGRSRIGIFGKLCKGDRLLHSGDRVEIYRPLLVDPRVARRELAAAGKTMGKHSEDGDD